VIDLYLCHAAADRDVAASICSRLERAEAKVWLEQCDSIPEVWDGGLSSTAILLLLSPDAVPQRWNRGDWEPLLAHVAGNARPPVSSVLIRECAYPKLLGRKDFHRWDDDRPEVVLRALESLVLSLHPESESHSFVPARLPWFEGRQSELDELWIALVDKAGAAALSDAEPGSGKTSLAQEFARAASGQFLDVLWIECGGRSRLSVAAELATHIGASLQGSVEEAIAGLEQLIAQHRLLVVLDDVTGDIPISLAPDGRASLLITTRLPLAGAISVPSFEPPHALADTAIDPTDLSLWEAMSVCRPQGFPLEFAARIAGMTESDARAASQRLLAHRWIDPVDAGGSRFRLGARGGAAWQSEAARLRHSEVLTQIFAAWRSNPANCGALLAEMDSAFQWALVSNWSVAVRLAERAFGFLTGVGRPHQAVDLYSELRDVARERQDLRVAENCSSELAWIQDDNGDIRRRAVSGDQLALDFLIKV
jgi:hypothetical protein